MKILYIGGAGRSGSTLLELIIGNIPGFFSVGEVIDFWRYYNDSDYKCGCGKIIRECGVWSKVISEFEKEGEEFANSTKEFKDLFDRSRNYPISPLINLLSKAKYKKYIDRLSILYKIISETIGDKIIVDSSKTPLHLQNLINIPGIDIRVIHLIRDPRAVAYSWRFRNKPDPSSPMNNLKMPKRDYINSLFRWALENEWVSSLKKLVTRYTKVTYEELSSNPILSIEHALNNLGFSEIDLSFIDNCPLDLSPTHSISGNPVRFQINSVTVQQDNDYLDKLNAFQFFLSGFIIFPWLHRNRYKLFK